MQAVVLGVLAGALFGAFTVAVRWGLGRGGDPFLGAAVITSTGFVVTALAALPSSLDGVDAGELWPFAVIGALVPGLSQVLFIYAVRHAGPSRAAILIGTAPLLSVALAVVALDEPVQSALLIGTVAIVAGGIVLARERARPAAFRPLGALLALVCAALFAVRDNVVRSAAREVGTNVVQATAVSLLAAAASATVLFVLLGRGRRSLQHPWASFPAFLPAGLLLGLAYTALVAGFARGRVGLVAPLNATQSLWAVLFASLLYARSEAVGRRTVVASALVVCGGVLIGAFR